MTHDLDPQDLGPQDACGVFGVWAPGEEVAKLAYFGLYALQHRGQESAGIAVGNGRQILVYKDMGLVSQVFNEATLSSLKGHVAIGHARYSTTGSSVWHNAQPTFRPTPNGSIALGHNGNLINTGELAKRVDRAVQWAARRRHQDGRGLHRHRSGHRVAGVVPRPHAGAGSARDLAVGQGRVLLRLHGPGYAVRRTRPARDPSARARPPRARLGGRLRDRGARHRRRHVRARDRAWRAGAIDEDGLRSQRFAEPAPKGCLFEFVYLARPDTLISGQRVHSVRAEIGRRLAREFPVDADLVIPVPESGTPAAIGYAEESKIPYGQGFVKNSYVGRTFIQPSNTIRQLGIRLKLNALRDVVEGKRLVVVDDSIVRGNTQRAQVRMLREAGAKRCTCGSAARRSSGRASSASTSRRRAELIANGMSVDEIRRSIGADSLGYISLDGLVEATKVPGTSCAGRASTGCTRWRCRSRTCSASICSSRRSSPR